MNQRDWCRQFRMLLERLLVGRAFPDRLVELSWHEHLLSCGACRELLEAEEALELLLASLPAPELPPELSRRVLARLKAERGLVAVPRESRTEARALDELLEQDRVEAPPRLAERVLAGLASERESARGGASTAAGNGHYATVSGGVVTRRAPPAAGADPLDALLELVTVDPPEGLARRVLARVRGGAPEASDAPAPARPPVALRLVRSRLAWAAAGVLLLASAGIAWLLRPDGRSAAPGERLAGEPVEREPTARGAEEPPAEELLAVLDLLADDIVWEADDLELELSVSLNTADEVLLDFLQDGEVALDGDVLDEGAGNEGGRER